MGLILCQWAKHLGATVIGTVSTDEEGGTRQSPRCPDHVAVYSREDFVPLVMEVTEGKGCPVVYESIGKDTFTRSPGLFAPARHPGELRPCLGRAGPPSMSWTLGATRLAVRHPSGAHALCRGTRGPGRFGAGVVRRRLQRGQWRSPSATAIRCARPLTCTAPSRHGAPPARRCFCRSPNLHFPPRPRYRSGCQLRRDITANGAGRSASNPARRRAGRSDGRVRSIRAVRSGPGRRCRGW